MPTDPKPLTAEQLAKLKQIVRKLDTSKSGTDAWIDANREFRRFAYANRHALLAAAEAVQTDERDAEIERLRVALEGLAFAAQDLLIYANTKINEEVDDQSEWAKRHNALVYAHAGHSHEYWNYITEYRHRLESTLEPTRAALKAAWDVLPPDDAAPTPTPEPTQ